MRVRTFLVMFDCVALAGGLAYVAAHLLSCCRPAAPVTPGVVQAGTDLGVSPRGDLFGGVVWFAGGQRLPAGRYRVEYADGCLKYSGSQGWSLHAYADGHDGWWLVGEAPADRIVMPPGTVGFLLGAGGFPTLGDCVAANRARAPIEFAFRGGRLGVRLSDEYYDDNLTDEDGRSPTWRLTQLTED